MFKTGAHGKRGATWPINPCSPWTPTPAGAWPTTGCNGCSNAGRLCRAPQRWATAPSRIGAGLSFIGSEKRVLARVLGERGVVLTAEAQARLAALPDRFTDFIAAPDGLGFEVAA